MSRKFSSAPRRKHHVRCLPGDFWIALHQQTVVGSIALLDIGQGQTALRKMFVHKEFRGPVYGTAKLLLTTLLDWAKMHQINEIYLGFINMYSYEWW